MHKPGTIYFIEGTYNLLSQFQMKGNDYAVLISLDGWGNRWIDPIQVENMTQITEEEMNKIAGNKPYEKWNEPLVINKYK